MHVSACVCIRVSRQEYAFEGHMLLLSIFPSLGETLTVYPYIAACSSLAGRSYILHIVCGLDSVVTGITTGVLTQCVDVVNSMSDNALQRTTVCYVRDDSCNSGQQNL
jgi:hypothetical protein